MTPEIIGRLQRIGVEFREDVYCPPGQIYAIAVRGLPLATAEKWDSLTHEEKFVALAVQGFVAVPKGWRP